MYGNFSKQNPLLKSPLVRRLSKADWQFEVTINKTNSYISSQPANQIETKRYLAPGNRTLLKEYKETATIRQNTIYELNNNRLPKAGGLRLILLRSVV